MKLTAGEKDEVKIITLEGKVMGSPDETIFHDTIQKYIEEKNVQVVLDLSQVDWMASAGLGMCVTAMTSLRNKGGDLRLAALSGTVKTIMTRCRLITIFLTYDSVDKAVASFK